MFAPGSGRPARMTVAGNLAFQSGALYLVQVDPSNASLANVTAAHRDARAAPCRRCSRRAATHAQLHHPHAAGGLGGTTFGGSPTSNLPRLQREPELHLDRRDPEPHRDARRGRQPQRNQQQRRQRDQHLLQQWRRAAAEFRDRVRSHRRQSRERALAPVGRSRHRRAAGRVPADEPVPRPHARSVRRRPRRHRWRRPAIGFAPEREALPDDIALAYAKAMKAPVYKAAAGASSSAGARGAAALAATTGRSGDPAVVGSHDLTARAAGFAAGLDYRFAPDTVVGFALAGGGTNWSLAQGLGGGKSDAFQAGVYARDAFRAGLCRGIARLHQSLDVDRPLRASRRPSHRRLQRAELRRPHRGRLSRRRRRPARSRPMRRCRRKASARPPTARPTSTAAASRSPTMPAPRTATRSELGARFDNQFLLDPNAVLTLRGRLAWAHDWVSDPRSPPPSRRCRARASSSTARRRRRIPRWSRPARSCASPTA